MNRWDVIAAGAALMTISGSALAQTSHSDHAAVSSLFDAANNCVKSGLVCSNHLSADICSWRRKSCRLRARRGSDAEPVRDTGKAGEP